LNAMLSRLMIAILLLSSHTLTLRAAMVSTGPTEQQLVTNDSCCPLCVPVANEREPVGCGCGCGDVQQDDRLPDSPSDTPGIINAECGLPDGEALATSLFSFDAPSTSIRSSVHDDASGHCDTLRFLARVGVWLN